MAKKASKKPTPRDVATHMARVIAQQAELYQNKIVHEIEEKFGADFVYENTNGNPAISPDVLREFRKMTPDGVWVRSQRYWCRREDSDEPKKRMQDY